MINWFNKKHKIIKFIICIIFVFIILFLIKNIYTKQEEVKQVSEENKISTSIIKEKEEYYEINIKYPKFINKDIASLIKEFIYEYTTDFKKLAKGHKDLKNKLKIDYKIIYLENNLIIYFEIDNTLNRSMKSKSLIIDTKNNKLSDINSIINNKEDKFKNIITTHLTKKYPLFVTDLILSNKIENYDYFIGEKEMIIDFNNYSFTPPTSYIPSIKINLEEIKDLLKLNIIFSPTFSEEQKEIIGTLALTFDDGPGKYTNEVIDVLEENDSHATFFVQGYRLRSYQEVMLRQVSLGNEIGSHTYNHKNLTKIDEESVNYQLNTTNIIFNEITGSNLSLLRPPYGSYNSKIKEIVPYPIIMWSIDTKDWALLDKDKVSEFVLTYATDGAIILMHDIHESTKEAIKIVVPELKARGFNLTTVSELAKIKGITLENGEVYKSF